MFLKHLVPVCSITFSSYPYTFLKAKLDFMTPVYSQDFSSMTQQNLLHQKHRGDVGKNPDSRLDPRFASVSSQFSTWLLTYTNIGGQACGLQPTSVSPLFMTMEFLPLNGSHFSTTESVAETPSLLNLK